MQRGSRTIDRQREELNNRVIQLSDLIRQTEALNDRVRRAAFRSATVNEQFLRQISADLHDGPGQDMGLALMQIEALVDHARRAPGNDEPVTTGAFDTIRASLQSALSDLRAICGGLRLPDIDRLPLSDVAQRAVRDYERKSGAAVALQITTGNLQGPLPVKIALYRPSAAGIAVQRFPACQRRGPARGRDRRR